MLNVTLTATFVEFAIGMPLGIMARLRSAEGVDGSCVLDEGRKPSRIIAKVAGVTRVWFDTSEPLIHVRLPVAENTPKTREYLKAAALNALDIADGRKPHAP